MTCKQSLHRYMYVHVFNFLNYPSSLFTLCFPLSVSRIPLLIISYKIESGNSPALLLSSLTKAVNLVRACVKALRAAAHRNAHRWICKCEWANSLRVGRTTPNINGVNYIIFEKKGPVSCMQSVRALSRSCRLIPPQLLTPEGLIQIISLSAAAS